MFVNKLSQRQRQASRVARRHLFLVAMNVCWRASEKRPLCLKRLSDANAPQSHQRDPTFVTPPAPTLQHIWGQIFHVYVLDLSTKHYSTPTVQHFVNKPLCNTHFPGLEFFKGCLPLESYDGINRSQVICWNLVSHWNWQLKKSCAEHVWPPTLQDI